MQRGRIPFPICPHRNVQQFTECCLDCGYNLWTGAEDWEKDKQAAAHERDVERMRKSWNIAHPDEPL